MVIRLFNFRLIGIAFGSISMIGCVFLKFIKEDMCCECGSKEVNPIETEHKVVALKGDHSSGGMARRYSSLVNYTLITIETRSKSIRSSTSTTTPLALNNYI